MPDDGCPVRSGDPHPTQLTSAQRAALSHVESLVRRQQSISRRRVNDALDRARCLL